MELTDVILLLHPFVAVAVVFPLLGVVVSRALQTRQRRLQSAKGEKSKLPAAVGPEHVQSGRWLASAAVGVVLLALADGIFGRIVKKNIWAQNPAQVGLIVILFGVVIAALVLLYRANTRGWRAAFATLCGASLVVLGCQDGVYRQTPKWYVSHYYYGMAAALILIFSVSIVREIYQDKSQRWRTVHVVLNSVAGLMFMAQAFTGAQALLEIPLDWQKPYIQALSKQHCNQQPCVVAPQTSP
jgi:ABC-type uncharacterized transport system permease subunit